MGRLFFKYPKLKWYKPRQRFFSELEDVAANVYFFFRFSQIGHISVRTIIFVFPRGPDPVVRTNLRKNSYVKFLLK